MTQSASSIHVNPPILLEGTRNTRSLGGYRNKEMIAIKENRFFRSDSTHGLTENDMKQLALRNVKCVIDLRSDYERSQAPSAFRQNCNVDYYEVPISDGIASNGFSGQLPCSMGQLYVDLLSNQADAFAQVFHIIARYEQKGAVLYHCTVGKDRTGLVSMFLLSLANVDQATILADYQTSEANMREFFEQQQKRIQQTCNIVIPDAVFSSDPKELSTALDYITSHYTSPQAYLLKNGVTQEEIDKIKKMLLV